MAALFIQASLVKRVDEFGAWERLAQVLLMSNEFVYLE